MPDLWKSSGAILLLYGVYRLLKFIYLEYTSPLRDLPGPKSSSWIYGNFKEMWAAEPGVVQERWVQEYGHTVKFSDLLGSTRFFTLDTKALNHVLKNNYIYQRPAAGRYILARIIGPGLLVTEEDVHKQQRRIMNPAFGPVQVRELTDVFFQKSLQLRDIWASMCTDEGGSVRVNGLTWLNRMTLDIIGLAGFNYKFNALNSNTEPEGLNKALGTMFGVSGRPSLLTLLQGKYPILRILPAPNGGSIREAQDTMARIGKQLLQDSKAAIASGDEKTEKHSRDLLSLLVRANMAQDLPQNQRLSDEDVLAQVPTFFIAGHETTSSGVTWALFALTQHVKAQTKLRNELLEVLTDNPTMDELNALPYLDHVVRETLRVHAPVPNIVRVAMKDDVIPLNTPFTDRKGRVHEEIRIRKGQAVQVPILALNRAPHIWGPDSMEFKPERWESIPEGASSIPGVWSHLLTFIGGPRACIGYRFSLVEMKAILFTLIRAFEFELTVPADEIRKKTAIVQRPYVSSDPDGGSQLPILVKLYKPRG